jgi:hypothetical protein
MGFPGRTGGLMDRTYVPVHQQNRFWINSLTGEVRLRMDYSSACGTAVNIWSIALANSSGWSRNPMWPPGTVWRLMPTREAIHSAASSVTSGAGNQYYWRSLACHFNINRGAVGLYQGSPFGGAHRQDRYGLGRSQIFMMMHGDPPTPAIPCVGRGLRQSRPPAPYRPAGFEPGAQGLGEVARAPALGPNSQPRCAHGGGPVACRRKRNASFRPTTPL